MEEKKDDKSENHNEIKTKIDSIHTWLDDEDSKYSKEINQINENIQKEENKNKILITNKQNINESSKNDILSNINKFIEESEKKDQYFISSNNKKINYSSINDNFNNFNYYNNINTSEILGLTLELNETKKTNNLMKETIQDLKNEISKNELEYQENLSKELDKQKYYYEDQIQNLKSLITNLMSEKKKLNNTISDLAQQIGQVESSYKKKMNELIEYHKNDNEKTKDAWFQAEKNRRKKWEETKIKEIKEMTIKNLEPELDKILQDHKKELLTQEETLKDNFRLQKEKLISEYENKIERMKNIFSKEKEEIQEKERKEYIKRLREQNLRLEDQHNSEQKKWYVSLQDEIKRLEELRNKDKQNYENDLNKLVDKYNKLIDEKEKFWKDNMDKIEEKYKKRYEIKLEEEKKKLYEEKLTQNKKKE